MAKINIKSLSDQRIIELYLDSQNPTYFSEIYERYSGKVFGKCLTLLRDSALAEDAAQDIFTKIFLKLSSFNKDAMFSTWLYAITYNYCIDIIRKDKKSIFSDMDEKNLKDVSDDEIGDRELKEMEIEELKKALNKIPQDDQAILLMKYHDDMSIKEICDLLDKSESAVKMKILRAKQRVRDVYVMPTIFILIIYMVLWMIA